VPALAGGRFTAYNQWIVVAYLAICALALYRIWRARAFDLAAQSFGRSADTDRPAALFRARAQQMAANPPGQDWDPIRTLQEK